MRDGIVQLPSGDETKAIMSIALMFFVALLSGVYYGSYLMFWVAAIVLLISFIPAIATVRPVWFVVVSVLVVALVISLLSIFWNGSVDSTGRILVHLVLAAGYFYALVHYLREPVRLHYKIYL